MKENLQCKISTWMLTLSIISLLGCSDEESPVKLKDIDGNVYTTVTIGTQTWMVENLKTTTYRNGDPIERIGDADEWASVTLGAYATSPNADLSGVLYNGYAVSDPRKLCPDGWHIPTKEEWQTLIDFLGGSSMAGGALKEVGTKHWSTPNEGATNSSGFTALPGGGYRIFPGGIDHVLVDYQSGFYWTSSESLSKKSNYAAWLTFADVAVPVDAYLKNCGFSVRCIKD